MSSSRKTPCHSNTSWPPKPGLGPAGSLPTTRAPLQPSSQLVQVGHPVGLQPAAPLLVIGCPAGPMGCIPHCLRATNKCWDAASSAHLRWAAWPVRGENAHQLAVQPAARWLLSYWQQRHPAGAHRATGGGACGGLWRAWTARSIAATGGRPRATLMLQGAVADSSRKDCGAGDYGSTQQQRGACCWGWSQYTGAERSVLLKMTAAVAQSSWEEIWCSA